jgi:hypothetical protein
MPRSGASPRSRSSSAALDGLTREAHGDLGLQRELAGAFVRVGDAQGHSTSANIGDSAGARVSYQRAIDIASAILATSPADVEERMGTLGEHAGDLAAAATAYQKSFVIRRALAAEPPASLDVQRDVAIAYEKLGNVQLALEYRVRPRRIIAVRSRSSNAWLRSTPRMPWRHGVLPSVRKSSPPRSPRWDVQRRSTF